MNVSSIPALVTLAAFLSITVICPRCARREPLPPAISGGAATRLTQPRARTAAPATTPRPAVAVSRPSSAPGERPRAATAIRAWPVLSAFETDLVESARRSPDDPEVLLKLTLWYSGLNTASEMQRYLDLYRAKRAQMAAEVDGSEGPWDRGHKLFRAFHQYVLPIGTSGELSGYVKGQVRIERLLDEGTYNCLSSAIAYGIFAKAFGVPVEGVILPTHAFLQSPSRINGVAKLVEIETTSAKGFDWIHDKTFYDDRAEKWSASRDLSTPTLEDYERRETGSLRWLIGYLGFDSRLGDSRVDSDRAVRLQVAALLDPTPDRARRRLDTLRLSLDRASGSPPDQWGELVSLLEVEVDRANGNLGFLGADGAEVLYDSAGDLTVFLADKQPDRVRLIAAASALAFRRASSESTGAQEYRVVSTRNALEKAARALARRESQGARALVTGLSGALPDADETVARVLAASGDEVSAKQEWEAAGAIFSECAVLRSSRQSRCRSNREVAYLNVASGAESQGNWKRAIEALRTCVNHPPSPRCRERLDWLNARHVIGSSGR